MKPVRSLFTVRTALLAVLALLTVGLISRALSDRVSAASLDDPAARKPVPDFTVRSLDGSNWKLADHQGKVVLINLFATWCPPCRAEMPGLVETIAAYQPKGVDALAISLDQNGEKVVPPFVAKYQMNFPVGYPGEGPSIADGVSSIPMTVLIDRSGRLAQAYVGMVNETELQHDLDRLLAEGR